jgi:hypothetical protein
LSLRISERIRVHEATLSALDTRIKNREGDQWFDVRVEDGMKTLGELESEREHYRGRVLQLTLLRDGLAADEIYALGSADLRLADLIPNDCPDVSTMPEERCVDDRRTMAIDGLKLTISGHELRRLLEQRMRDHARRAERWRAEQARTPEQETDDQPVAEPSAQRGRAGDWRAAFDHPDRVEAGVSIVNGISRSVTCCPRSPDGSSRRNTKSARASDSSWNDSPRGLANYRRWTLPSPRGRQAVTT